MNLAKYMPHQSARLSVMLFWLFFTAAAVNVILYVANTASPYLRADGWFFLSDFLIPWYQGEFKFSDLYTVRDNSDHVQPVHRMLFFVNANIFDLDFRKEAVFAVLFLILSAYILIRHCISIAKEQRKNKLFLLFLLVFTLATMGFNTNAVYTWSLVTLGYMTVFVNISLFIMLSTYINRIDTSWRDMMKIMILSSLSLFVGDDIGMLVMIISVFVLFIVFVISKEQKILWLAVAVVALLILYIVIKQNIITILNPNAVAGDLQKTFQFYLAEPERLVAVVTIPLADSIIHLSYLKKLFAESASSISFMIGILILFSHLLAWYLFIRHRLYKRSYVPIFLLLYSYAMLAGVLIYRIPVFDVQYLHSPRYMGIYQIGLWGLILSFITYYLALSKQSRHRIQYIMLTVSILFFVLQAYLLQIEWKNNHYINKYSENVAATIIYYSGYSDDERIGKPCENSSHFQVCNMSEAKRTHLVKFLKDNQLNVFSDTIRKNYYSNLTE